MKNLATIALALALASGLTAPLAADDAGQDWTRFRGPNGQGISDAKTVPTTFGADDINWKVKLPGGGHSCPVLWDDKIFLTCANDDDGVDRFAVCLDAKDGSIRWSQRFESLFHNKHKFNSFAASTPAVDAERAYFVWSTPEEYTLIALTHEGKVAWRRDLGPFKSQHSCGTSPIVYNGLVILGNDQDEEGGGKSFLIAVDAKTGETRWQIERRSARVAYSTPCIYQPEGGQPQLIFNSQSHGITSLDPMTGRQNWEITTTDSGPLLTMRSVSSPVLADGLITISCGSGAGGNYLVAVRPPQGDSQAEAVYKIDARNAAPYVPTPIAYNGLLFCWSDKGTASCVDAQTGEVHWLRRVGSNFFGSPICIDGRLFCVSTDGEVYVLKADKEYELLAKNDLGELCHSTPAVAGGRLYVRTYNHLFSIGGKK